MSKEFQNPFAALRDPEVARDERRLNYAFIVVVILILAALVYFAVKSKTVAVSPCLILDAKYCDSGKLVPYANNQTMLGFNPAKGSNIYAPFSGTFVFTGKVRSDPSLNDAGRIDEPRSNATSTYSMYFFSEFKPLVKMGETVKKGEVVAQVEGGAIDQETSSTFLVGFEQTLPSGAQTEDLSALSKYFKVKP